MSVDDLKHVIVNSVDAADRAARRIKVIGIQIIMEEMRMTKPQARKAYSRLMGE